jgi:hypothetical protein
VYLAGDPRTGAEVLIQGQVELFHRLGAQGLRARISVQMFDVSKSGEYVMWMGAKDAEWIRRFPTDDCLLTLADDFVATWVRGT